jgi:hypothetical protein
MISDGGWVTMNGNTLAFVENVELDRLVSLAFIEYVIVIKSNHHTTASPLSTTVSQMLRSVPDLSPEALRYLLNPLLDSVERTRTSMWTSSMYHIICDGVRHQNCPPDILAKACNSRDRSIATYAAENPICPEEGSVLVALKYGTVGV